MTCCVHEHTLTCCGGTVDGKQFAMSMQAHALHPRSHSYTPCPQGSMLCFRERSRGRAVRKRRNAQCRLLQARANIGFWGTGLRGGCCTRLAYRMMYTLLQHRRCCELAWVDRREFLDARDVVRVVVQVSNEVLVFRRRGARCAALCVLSCCPICTWIQQTN